MSEIDQQQARFDHWCEVVHNLRPCSCGYDTVRIEPCEINCDNCGRFAANVNWEDAAREWNDGLADGPPPEVGGWV